jgi:hypothetical protein
MLYNELLRNNGSPMSTTKKKKKKKKKKNHWNRGFTRCTDFPPLCPGRQSELQDSAVSQCQGNEMTGL